MMSLNSAGWFGRGVNRSFPNSLRLSAQGKRKARKGKGKEEPAVRLRVVPHFSSGMVERAKRERA